MGRRSTCEDSWRMTSGAPDAAAFGDLVVAVEHRGSTGRWMGSGFLIGGSVVLTASHNVGDGDLTVRARGALGTGSIARRATVLKQGHQDVPDLALLQIDDPWVEAPSCRYGVVDRSTPTSVEGCWAVGFPEFKAFKPQGATATDP